MRYAPALFFMLSQRPHPADLSQAILTDEVKNSDEPESEPALCKLREDDFGVHKINYGKYVPDFPGIPAHLMWFKER